MLHADLDEIRRDAQIQSVIQEAGQYGKELQEKLDHHLAFMLENRRKYYKAVAELGR
jgi:chorismate mutase